MNDDNTRSVHQRYEIKQNLYFIDYAYNIGFLKLRSIIPGEETDGYDLKFAVVAGYLD